MKKRLRFVWYRLGQRILLFFFVLRLFHCLNWISRHNSKYPGLQIKCHVQEWSSKWFDGCVCVCERAKKSNVYIVWMKKPCTKTNLSDSLIDFRLCEMKIDESERVLIQWQQVGDVLICHLSLKESISHLRHQMNYRNHRHNHSRMRWLKIRYMRKKNKTKTNQKRFYSQMQNKTTE